MKYVLIIYLCTFLDQPQCFKSTVIPFEFPTYYDCITEGYKYSYNSLKEIDPTEIEDKKLAVKFECREVKLKKEKKVNT